MNAYEETNSEERELAGKKPVRKSLTREDVFRLDDDELTILDIIRDLGNLSRLGATDTLVIRQAKREGFSERGVNEIIKTLVKLGVVAYPDEYAFLEALNLDQVIYPRLHLLGSWKDMPRMQNRKQLTSEDVRTLDGDEKRIHEIIKDLSNLELRPTRELVIRQANRENISKRKATEMLDLLFGLDLIKYARDVDIGTAQELGYPFQTEPYIELTSPEKRAAEWAAAYLREGDVYRHAGSYEESIGAYDKAIELAPYDAAAWKGKGEALEALGRKTEAEQAFEKARELGVNGTKVGD